MKRPQLLGAVSAAVGTIRVGTAVGHPFAGVRGAICGTVRATVVTVRVRTAVSQALALALHVVGGPVGATVVEVLRPTRDVVVSFQGHYSRFVDMAH